MSFETERNLFMGQRLEKGFEKVMEKRGMKDRMLVSMKSDY